MQVHLLSSAPFFLLSAPIMSRVRKSKNLPDSKIFTAKTSRIQCLNLDIADFATNARKPQKRLFRQFLNILDFSTLSGQLLGCPDSFQIVQTVSGQSEQFSGRPDSLWIIRTVSGLSGQFLDCPDSFWIIRTVSGLSGQFLIWGQYLTYTKNFPDCKNFPDSNAATLTRFF